MLTYFSLNFFAEDAKIRSGLASIGSPKSLRVPIQTNSLQKTEKNI